MQSMVINMLPGSDEDIKAVTVMAHTSVIPLDDRSASALLVSHSRNIYKLGCALHAKKLHDQWPSYSFVPALWPHINSRDKCKLTTHRVPNVFQ